MSPNGKNAAPLAEGETRRILKTVFRAAGGSVDRWIDEEVIAHAAFPDTEDIYYIRHRLKRLCLANLLERQKSQPARTVLVTTLTSVGESKLAETYLARGRTPPTPTRRPRLDQSVHHLLVVEASINILLASNGRLIRLQGDEDLRSLSRLGRRLATGKSDGGIPDGRLTYRVQSNTDVRMADIEILVSKYTDEQIKKKYAELNSSRTFFFAPTLRLCNRVKALVGHRPILIT